MEKTPNIHVNPNIGNRKAKPLAADLYSNIKSFLIN